MAATLLLAPPLQGKAGLALSVSVELMCCVELAPLSSTWLFGGGKSWHSKVEQSCSEWMLYESSELYFSSSQV